MFDFLTESTIGQAAGITTSILWVATSLLFTAAGKRIGPTVVNTIRIFIAIFLLGSTVLLTTGQLWPDITTQLLTYLALSGIIGLAIGDQALFTSFIYIGPRLAILIMSTSPIWAVLFGWVALDETLSITALGGILLTVSGVAWVVAERKESVDGQQTPPRSRFWVRGIILAFIGSLCQAGGILLSKLGMGHTATAGLESTIQIDALTATFIRMVFAALGVLPILLVRQILHRQPKSSHTATSTQKAASKKNMSHWKLGLLLTAAGSIVGPYLGVWLSLVAADHAPLGIAQTLCSLSPIMIIPVVAIVHKEHISLRAWSGAVIAVAGVAILVLT